MLLSLLFAVSSLALAEDTVPCPDATPIIDQALDLALQLEGAAADEKLAEAKATFACGGPAEPAVLAHMWLVQGARLHFDGDPVSAAHSFAAAHRVAPDVWDAALGDEARSAYESARAETRGQGQITADGLTADTAVWIDGVAATLPAEVVAGVHMVQAGASETEIYWAEGVFVGEGGTSTVTVPAPDAVEGLATTAGPARSFPTFLVAGGGALVLGGAAAGLALAQNGKMQTAPDSGTLDQAFSRQQTFGYAAYGLAALGAVGVGLHFAF